MAEVEALPFNEDWGYPQEQRVKVSDVAYSCFYRWNYLGGFPALTITRVTDSALVFNGKLVVKNVFTAKDPDTDEELFVLLPWRVDENNAEVWVFYD